MAITIVQGENKTVKIRVSSKRDCKPWNFSGFTGATASFANANGLGGPYNVVGTNVAGTNELQFPLLPADSMSLLPGDSIDFQYQWMQNGELFIEQVFGQLNVLSQLFGL